MEGNSQTTVSWRDLPLVLVNPTTSFDDLPVCLVADILSRLPVKSIIRSNAVNTTWYSLLKNPKFISLHLHRSISLADKNGDNYLFITPSSSPTNSCSLITQKTFTEETTFEIPFRTGSGLVTTHGSINGLVCLGDGSLFAFGREFYLWNPSLKKHRHVSSSCYDDLLIDPLMTYAVIGFGYHEAADDYQILRIFFRSDESLNFFGLKPKVEIYSLRTDSWRKIKCNVPRLLSHADWIFVNGYIYWLEWGNSEWIVSFDLKKQVFEEFKFPRNVRRRAGKSAKVSVMNYKGLVSICSNVQDVKVSQYSVWVLRRDDNGSVSWTEQIKAVSKIVGLPVMFTNCGKLVLETIGPSLQELTNLTLCDLEKKNFFVIGRDGPYTGDNSFVESLVMFDGGKLPFKRYKLVDLGF